MKAKIIKLLKYTFFLILVLVFVVLLKSTGPGLWNYFVTYPKLEKEITEFRLKYKKPKQYIGNGTVVWTDGKCTKAQKEAKPQNNDNNVDLPF